MVTIKDIAELSGVAKSTVSRYLNNGQVSPATQKKISKVIEETGYKPNAFARSLKAQKTNMVGVIIPRLNSPSTNDVLAGIDETARQLGYQLVITNSNQSEERELENIDILIKQKVSGIIILAQFITKELQEKIQQSPVPILTLGQEIPRVHGIVHADYEAGKKMAQHGLSLGHETFLFVGVNQIDRAVGVLRKQGFMDEIYKQGKQVTCVETSFSKRETYRKAISYLPSNTASYVCCATDNIAIAVLKAAYELNQSVPRDFSLSGFGGYDATNYVTPSITTIVYPYLELGNQAINLIHRLIKNEEVPYVTELPNVLEARGSTTIYNKK